MRLDDDMRIEARDGVPRAFHLGTADVLRGVDHLTLEIGQRNGVVVDDAERADARRGEILQQRRAEPAGADDENPRMS